MTFGPDTGYLEHLRREARKFKPLPVPGQGIRGGAAAIQSDLDIVTGSILGIEVIVAASGASDDAKAIANYVCDGTNDQVEVQAAIDSLPDEGGTVHWLGRTFNLQGDITMPENIWLVGHEAKIDIANTAHIYFNPAQDLAPHTAYATNAFTGFEVTRSVGGTNAEVLSTNNNTNMGRLLVYGNWFHDIDCGGLISPSDDGGSWMGADVFYNDFYNINLRAVGAGVTYQGLMGIGESPGRAIKGIFAFNRVNQITRTAAAGAEFYILVGNTDTNYDLGMIGNHITNITQLNGLTGGQGTGNAWQAHNMVDDVMQAGDHSNMVGVSLSLPVYEVVPLSWPDDILVLTGKHRIYFPHAATLVSVRAALGTAPTGSAATFDLKKNGTSVMATPTTISIADGTNVSSKAVPTTTAIADGDYITVDITGVGSTTAGADLTVTVEYRRDETAT